MAAKHGNLSINSENIFPIIKKWLYSDHDIFVRELVSNGCYAITKLKKLEVMGEYTFPDDYKAAVQVVVDPDAKTLKFIDNGIGMTGDEVEEYITQIAFSGATEFLEKYKDKTTDDQMIGHFGLGFYSAFMVADEVHIDTLSYKDGATAVHWTCDGGTEYDMQDGDRTTPGTEITLFLNEESLEFCNEYRMREVIEKYCSFMPVPIFLNNEKAEPQYETIEKDELTEKDTIIELKTTDESGWIHFMADLPISAKYYLKEIYAPNGYVRGTETQEFTFEYQGDKTTQAVYEFTFEDVQTSVELSKADLTDGKELPGASLQVLDSNGTVVEEWISTDEPHLIRGLLVGETYTMVETKPADGYTTAERIEFKVEDTAEVQKHQMLDDVTKVEISKTDVTDSKEVPGAKLTILDKDGKVVEEKKGEFLKRGKYAL